MASTVLPNGIIIPEKYSRDWYNDLYHNWQELDNLLAGGGANDGTLTIQKNGTTVGTFSANQATDETVNISVPTATSDLTNDSGFITEDNTKIPLAGSNAISGSLIPATTNAYDLGGSSYQWKSINGIAPDELGLPTNTYTDVSSYITHFDSTQNAFTAPVSGLLFFEGIRTDSTPEGAISNRTKGYYINLPYAYYHIRGLFPVEKGDNIIVNINKQLSNFSALIYHLKGKV